MKLGVRIPLGNTGCPRKFPTLLEICQVGGRVKVNMTMTPCYDSFGQLNMATYKPPLSNTGQGPRARAWLLRSHYDWSPGNPNEKGQVNKVLDTGFLITISVFYGLFNSYKILTRNILVRFFILLISPWDLIYSAIIHVSDVSDGIFACRVHRRSQRPLSTKHPEFALSVAVVDMCRILRVWETTAGSAINLLL
jgi:hypothetical protein